MIEPAIVVVRLLQYGGAAILLGSSLFFLRLAPPYWPRRWLACAALGLALAALLSIGLQAALFAGDWSAIGDTTAIGQVIAFLPMGPAAMVRAGAALAAAALLVMAPQSQLVRSGVVGLGAVSAASLAWLGHAGGAKHTGHLLADIAHCLAASGWLGALAGFLWLIAQRPDRAILTRALRRFSGIGMALVAVLVVSGVTNLAYIAGLAALPELPSSTYGRLLLAKLAAFAGMLGFAAWNRQRLTPALAAGGGVERLRASIGAEAALALTVLALVAWLGTLEPPGVI